ncbi:MAG: RDD family protein [Acidimicrobiales bacterium]|jgi:uncharacterized RDD family membrane protein YckC|nr:RDD family protein [Acidimicrobiales bacterium]
MSPDAQDRPPEPAASTQRPRKLPEAKDFPKTGPNSLAAPGPRFGARGVDLAIVVTPALIVAALSVTARGDQVEIDAPTWLPWLVLGVAVAYEFALLAIWGRTVGKWVFGLRVARYTDGRRPQPSQAILRALVPWAPLALPLPFASAFVLGLYATGAGGSLHRGVPDQAAGTVVIATR